MALEIVPVTEYKVLGDVESTKEAIESNLGGESLNQFDLVRIKIPAAGATSWMVPGIGGEEMVKEISGVIVHWKDGRVYWKDAYGTADAKQPDCASDDAVTGVGSPGGICAQCPHAQFATASTGRGQACKMLRHLFVIRKNDLLPIVVTLPPSSVGVVRKFFTQLTSASMPFFYVEVSLGLEKAHNDAGIAYSRVVPVVKRVLDDQSVAVVRALRQRFEPSLKALKTAGEDY